MKKTLFAAILFASAAFATPLVTFDTGSGFTALNSNQSIGWQFDVLTSLTINELGWFDSGLDGLTTAHTLGIWDPSGALLASVLVPAGTVAPLDGDYRMVLIAPIALAVGSGYIVGGENFNSNTERVAFNSTQTVDPRLLYIDATFSSVGSGFTRPTNFSSATTGFYGPMIGEAAVPEPATLLLAGSALLMIGFLRRRKAL